MERSERTEMMSEPLDKREEEWTAPIDGEFEVIHGGLRQSVVPLEVHKSSLAANREQKAEIERLTALEFTLQAQRDLLFGVVKAIADAQWRKWEDGLNTPQDFIAWAKSIASAAVSDTEKLASLRASAGEKPEDAWKRGWDTGYQYALDQVNCRTTLAFRKYVAPPSLPTEKEK
jgi:hypothetical protein